MRAEKQIREDNRPLHYSDPTPIAAIRQMENGTFTVESENGVRFYLRSADLLPLLGLWEFRESQRGHVWGTLRKGTS